MGKENTNTIGAWCLYHYYGRHSKQRRKFQELDHSLPGHDLLQLSKDTNKHNKAGFFCVFIYLFFVDKVQFEWMTYVYKGFNPDVSQ